MGHSSGGNGWIGLNSATPDSPPNNHSGLNERQWNALIGIVTAIVGNILISFALNLQRYAHIRISRERAAWELRGKTASSTEYGTQAKIAEERSRINLKTPVARGGSLPLRREYDETTPLQDGRRPSNFSEGIVQQDVMDDEEQQQNKNYLKSPWWWSGIVLMTVGEAGNFLAFVSKTCAAGFDVVYC